MFFKIARQKIEPSHFYSIVVDIGADPK